MKFAKQNRVLTAIVGSYPKPDYVYPRSGRDLLDSYGFSFDALRQEVDDKNFHKRLDRAALEAINDQAEACIDFITDGEERRGHYVLAIVNKLRGIDVKNLKKVSIRGGVVQRDLPQVIAKIQYDGPIVLDEYKFTRGHVGHSVAKIGLPGPSTVADSVANTYYGDDKERFANDYADAIRQEVGVLIDKGCQVIQFDDPVLLRDPAAAKTWGLKALERCFAGFEDRATFIVHICRGYPDKGLEKQGVEYKANAGYYKDVLSWLSKSKLDIVSIEGAQSDLALSILPAIGKKTVMLGVLDVGDERVETVEELTKRGKEALKYLPKDQLILAPDCGMLEISREAAKQKLQNLAIAASRL